MKPRTRTYIFIGLGSVIVVLAAWIVLQSYPDFNLPATTIGTIAAATFAAFAAGSADRAKVSAQEIERSLGLVERVNAQTNIDAPEIYKGVLLDRASRTSVSPHEDDKNQVEIDRVELLSAEFKHVLDRSRAFSRVADRRARRRHPRN